MYVCMYLHYMHVYIYYTQVSVCIHIYANVCMGCIRCMDVCVLYTCIHIYYTDVSVYIKCICTCANMFIHVLYVCVCVHVFVHTYKYVQAVQKKGKCNHDASWGPTGVEARVGDLVGAWNGHTHACQWAGVRIQTHLGGTPVCDHQVCPHNHPLNLPYIDKEMNCTRRAHVGTWCIQIG